MNYLIFKNKNSLDLDGLIIQELPPITKAPKRYNKISIDGKDGDIIEELGYDAYDKPVKIGLSRGFNIDSVIEYFNGEGDLILSNEPDKVYKAVILEQIDYERLVRFKTANIIFHVQPYKYLLNEGYRAITSGIKIVNTGNVKCKPSFHLKGTGDVTFTINSVDTFIYKFGTTESEVYIDSEKEDAYLSLTLKNDKMSGDFPILKAGVNTISWSGTLSLCEINLRTRWL